MVAQIRAAQQVAQNRLIIQLRRETTWPRRLEAANQLVEQGDLATACAIYMRLVAVRPPTPHSEAAKARLQQLQQDARQKRKSIDDQLADAKLVAENSPEKIADLFEQYDKLVQHSAGIPVVNRELEKHVAKQRRDPFYLAILNESRAQQLVEFGIRYEQDGCLCCAQEVYTEASRLTPAKSATRAAERLLVLGSNLASNEEIKQCRTLQECQQKFQEAEVLKDAFPEEARDKYRWIVMNAPKESRVSITSTERLGLITTP